MKVAQERGLGVFVREKRLARRLTQEQLAELIGRTQKYVSQLELNRTEGYLPPPETLRELATALETTEDELLRAAGYRVEADEPEIDLADPALQFWASHAGELTEDERRLVIDVARTILRNKGKG